MAATDISNPIINSPYEPPERTSRSARTGRPARSFPAVAPASRSFPCQSARKGRQAVQQALDFDLTGERREPNTLINDIRREVERWRANNWNGVTPYTRKLLAHWAPGRRTETIRCSSASGRRPRPRSSSPRSPGGTARPTTGGGSNPRTGCTTTACRGSA